MLIHELVLSIVQMQWITSKNVYMDGKWMLVATKFVQKDLVRFAGGNMNATEYAAKV